jgi:hypothetical protein
MQQEKNTRRVSIGHGWEASTTDSVKVEHPVRVRSGTNIVTGKLIGDKQQPRAFVWVDESANDPKRNLVICPDLNGTWLWENGKETTLQVAFPDNKEVQRLARRFDYWVQFLEESWTPDRSHRFFWGRFHDEGVALARRLQALIVEEVIVCYWRPVQDPRSNNDREIQL